MIIFVADLFAEQYRGGAELTTEAIYQSSLFPAHKVQAHTLNIKTMEHYKDAFWIFGNFANMSEDCILYAIKNLKYSVLEYDYKYCKFRSPGKHISAEGECNCHTTRHGKIVSMFLASSVMTWWMSRKQRDKYYDLFPFLKKAKDSVLNSVFSHETLNYIEDLDTTNKNNKWVIMNSQSWIKGVDDAVAYAKEHNLEYELLWGLEHKDFLKKLAESKGLIFLPKAGDTCPRMVVEAKLLDCELILNENVQHKDEAWFTTSKSVMSYLRKIAYRFWFNMEAVAPEALQVPSVGLVEHYRFHIVVPFYNCEQWIGKCINSLKRQHHSDFKCTLIDDMSTDDSYNKALKAIGRDHRFNLIRNTEKRYALGNIAHALESPICQENDVVVLLDGDDWLSSSNSLKRVCQEYDNKDCLLTYGSYVYFPNGQRGVEPSEYSQEVIKNNTFRQDQWRASHLRTFRHHLWKHLNHDDLKDETGDYFKMTYDQAIMLPLLELAGDRSSFIPDTLHTYNKSNPLNIDKNKAQEQSQLAQRIRSKKAYTRL